MNFCHLYVAVSTSTTPRKLHFVRCCSKRLTCFLPGQVKHQWNNHRFPVEVELKEDKVLQLAVVAVVVVVAIVAVPEAEAAPVNNGFQKSWLLVEQLEHFLGVAKWWILSTD